SSSPASGRYSHARMHTSPGAGSPTHSGGRSTQRPIGGAAARQPSAGSSPPAGSPSPGSQYCPSSQSSAVRHSPPGTTQALAKQISAPEQQELPQTRSALSQQAPATHTPPPHSSSLVQGGGPPSGREASTSPPSLPDGGTQVPSVQTRPEEQSVEDTQAP